MVPWVGQLLTQIRITLPLPDVLWAEWGGYYANSLSAGSSSAFSVATVPSNERWELHEIFVDRDSGDNTFRNLYLTYPSQEGPVAGTTKLQFYVFVAAAQTSRRIEPSHPMMLPPGTTITVTPDGTGTAATVINTFMRGRRTVVVRDQRWWAV
jgi:hypothetical protein